MRFFFLIQKYFFIIKAVLKVFVETSKCFGESFGEFFNSFFVKLLGINPKNNLNAWIYLQIISLPLIFCTVVLFLKFFFQLISYFVLNFK